MRYEFVPKKRKPISFRYLLQYFFAPIPLSSFPSPTCNNKYDAESIFHSLPSESKAWGHLHIGSGKKGSQPGLRENNFFFATFLFSPLHFSNSVLQCEERKWLKAHRKVTQTGAWDIYYSACASKNRCFSVLPASFCGRNLNFLTTLGSQLSFNSRPHEKTIKTASFIKVDHGAARGIKGLFDQISHTKVIFLIWNG